MADFNAREFFEFGTQIADAYGSSSAYRTAIGRAYYACFLIGRDAISRKGWFSPSGRSDDHSAVRRTLSEHGPGGVSDKLRDLNEMREHADYHTRSEQACRYCQSTDGNSWQRAQVIASDILPKLEAINPTEQSG